jgi:AAA family ATP:ADP antiporter
LRSGVFGEIGFGAGVKQYSTSVGCSLIDCTTKEIIVIMSKEERDPFPMTSPEAKALQVSSVDGKDNKKWKGMTTKTPDDTMSSQIADLQDASSSRLTGGGKDEDDLYAKAEQEEEEDEYLDIPLNELRGSLSDRWKHKSKRFLWKVYQRLYGDDLPPSEMVRILCLATTLFFMIGGYWLLRSLKDSVLMALCGYKAIPKAKMMSVFVVLGVVSVYNHLLDSDIPKHQLFYIFGTVYFFIFTVISFLLMDESIGLANKYQSEGRILGWVSYCAIESFGSVMVSLFWSFANSNISLKTAKSSYGVMVATAQLGSILGPSIIHQFAESWGLAKCYLMGACCMLCLQGTMYTYIKIYGTNEEQQSSQEIKSPKQKKERAGILEGLVLFWKHHYVKGIFAISCLFMVEVTIVDFTLKVLAQEFFSEEYPCLDLNPECYNAETGEYGLTEQATNAIASFMGLFGVATNTLSFCFSLLGTSAIIRHLGLRLTLLLFPSLCLIVIIAVRLHPTLNVVFFAMILLKGNSYALNNPTKEILYQPTSSAVRYKAKSWIDIFGARGSKALGSLVTNAFSDSAEVLVANGSLVGMCVASFLIWNAKFMGKLFDEYTESGYIVGQEDNPESRNLEMAISQQEIEDTSCALDEDDDNYSSGDNEDSQPRVGHDDDGEEAQFDGSPTQNDGGGDANNQSNEDKFITNFIGSESEESKNNLQEV